MRDEGHDPLDELIDTTARSLTEGTPPASLRVGVHERITSVGRPFVGRLAWISVAGAAAAAVLLIVGFGREEVPAPPGPVPVPLVAVVSPSDPPPAVPRPVPAPSRPRTRSAPSRAAILTAVRETKGVTADAVGDGPVVIELVEIEPLGPEPLDMELTEIPMPLRAESVVIDPISIE